MKDLKPPIWKIYLSDIRLWIFLFFLVRLYGITNPPLDPSTLWRQSDVLMIARNFYEVDNNIFYPRIDVSQSQDGVITGVEFPLYNYLIYLVSAIFGYSHWYGRLINLIFASIGIFYFNRVVKKYYTNEVAFTATLLLLASAWFAYSRTTFPDIFGAALCIASLYYGTSYFEQGKKKDLFIYFILSTLGCLVKISAISILSIMVIPVLSNRYSLQRKFTISLLSVIVLLLTVAWYFYWVPHLNSIGTSYFSMGFPISMGVHDIINEPLKFAKKFYDDPLKYSGSIAIILGFIYSIKNKNYGLLYAPVLVLAAYFIIILKSGKWFYINGYYFVMYVPALALLAAIGLNFLPKKIKFAFLLIIIVENIANQVHVFRVRDSYKFYTELEKTFDHIGSLQKDLIIVGCDECSAAPIYMSHRKGIILNKDQLLMKEMIQHYKDEGFKYILLQKGLHGLEIILPYPIIIDNKDFCIYKL